MNTERAHFEQLTRWSEPDAILSRNSASLSTKNASWFRQGRRLPHRQLLWEQIATAVEHATTRGDTPHAILMSGPPGAGKSSALEDVQRRLGADRRFRVVDPDAFKDVLLHASLRDGSYHEWLMPHDVWRLHVGGERFHPRELATLVHLESSWIATEITSRAIADRADLVLDGTLNNKNSATKLLGQLKEAGYTTTIVNVDCSRSQSLERCYNRWLAGRRAGLAAEADERKPWDDRLGGRFVPPQFANSLFDRANPSSATPLQIAKALLNGENADRLMTFRLPAGESQPVFDGLHLGQGSVLRSGNDSLATEALHDKPSHRPMNRPTHSATPTSSHRSNDRRRPPWWRPGTAPDGPGL